MEYFSSAWMWIGFAMFLAVALSIDTFVLGKKSGSPSWRKALFWTLCWVSCALTFNFLLWLYLYLNVGSATANLFALQFFTAYVIEKSLSVDNLFVFYMVFEHFKIAAKYQHRVLSYGIWGAVIMRLGVILVGIWLISKFHWLLYVMGAFLVFTGIKIILMKEKERDLSETLVLKLAKKVFRVTHEHAGHHFFVVKNKLLYATPLLIALIFVEVSDLVFAIDSIPAVFAITRDPFIVWTSNIFAILGLRAIYFLLAKMVEQLSLLKYGIALILVFVGVKMVTEPWIHIPAGASLCVIIFIILIFSVISMKCGKQRR